MRLSTSSSDRTIPAIVACIRPTVKSWSIPSSAEVTVYASGSRMDSRIYSSAEYPGNASAGGRGDVGQVRTQNPGSYAFNGVAGRAAAGAGEHCWPGDAAAPVPSCGRRYVGSRQPRRGCNQRGELFNLSFVMLERHPRSSANPRGTGLNMLKSSPKDKATINPSMRPATKTCQSSCAQT